MSWTSRLVQRMTRKTWGSSKQVVEHAHTSRVGTEGAGKRDTLLIHRQIRAL